VLQNPTPSFQKSPAFKPWTNDQEAWKHAARSADFLLIVMHVLTLGVRSFAQVNTAENAAVSAGKTERRTPALTYAF
jgi:hypothetical protein